MECLLEDPRGIITDGVECECECEDLDEDCDNSQFLMEQLSSSTFEALFQFLNPQQECENPEVKDEAPITNASVFAAYTPQDVSVIAQTMSRLQSAHRESQERTDLAIQQRVLLPLEVDSTISSTETLSSQGVVRINSVLSHDLCDACLEVINERLAEAIAVDDPMVVETGFGNVLAREHRWDIYMKNDGIITTTLRHLLGLSNTPIREALGPLFGGADASFHELSALVSDAGAVSQPIHPDTMYTDIAPLYTVFVALQDITDDMGATIFLPRTPTEECHRLHKSPTTKDAFLAKAEYRQALLKKGDCAIMDSRLLHCGDANYGDRRVLLYFTLRNPLYQGKDMPTGSKFADLNLWLNDVSA